MEKPKILLIGRHGKAPQTPGGSIDTLFPGSVTSVYKNTGMPLNAIVKEYGISPEKIFLTHSDKNRTRYTGQAVLIGAFDLQPYEGSNPPASVEDLAKYDFSGFKSEEKPVWCYGDPWTNTKLAKDGNYDVCIDYWLANPEATEHGGAPIISYNKACSIVMPAFKDELKKLIGNDNDAGVIASHAAVADIPVIALINSGLSRPIAKLDDIKGGVGMEEFAQLTIQPDLKASMIYKGENYKIDLNKI